MKQVKTQQKFKCDFCKKRSIKSVIAKHEPRCFRNPNRFCDNCQNKGYTEEIMGETEGYTQTEKLDCYYCGKFDPKILEEIKARESLISGG